MNRSLLRSLIQPPTTSLPVPELYVLHQFYLCWYLILPLEYDGFSEVFSKATATIHHGYFAVSPGEFIFPQGRRNVSSMPSWVASLPRPASKWKQKKPPHLCCFFIAHTCLCSVLGLSNIWQQLLPVSPLLFSSGEILQMGRRPLGWAELWSQPLPTCCSLAVNICTAAQWLALAPHNKKVLGLNPQGAQGLSMCEVCIFSLNTCMLGYTPYL